MKEDQELQDMFGRIEAGINASPGLRDRVGKLLAEPKTTRSRFRLALAGGLVGFACVIGVTIVLLPTASAAGMYRQIQAAIRDAKTMHVRSYSEMPGKPRRLSSDLYYANGDWRMDIFPGTRIARSMLHIGSDQYLYFAKSDVAVKEPAIAELVEGNQTALEFAESNTDDGRITGSRDFTIESRPDENGRPVYAVIATRKDTPYHLEMIVDKRTDLPIRSSFTGQPTSSRNYRVIYVEYSFGEPIGRDILTPQIQTTTKIVNLSTEADAIKTAWKNPLKTIRTGGTSVDVRNVAVNEKGEVFIACSFGKPIEGLRNVAFPQNLLPESITDDQGREYVLVDTLRPGAFFGDTKAFEYFKFGSDNLAITEWAPMQPMTPWQQARSIKTTFVARTWSGYPTYSEPSIRAIEDLPVSDVLSGDFPVYSTVMMLDEPHVQFEMIASGKRGEAYEKRREFGRAAYWYRDAAGKAWPPSSAKPYEDKAAKCLKELGKSTLP